MVVDLPRTVVPVSPPKFIMKGNGNVGSSNFHIFVVVNLIAVILCLFRSLLLYCFKNGLETKSVFPALAPPESSFELVNLPTFENEN